MGFYCYSKLIRTQIQNTELLIWQMYFLFSLNQEGGSVTDPRHIEQKALLHKLFFPKMELSLSWNVIIK